MTAKTIIIKQFKQDGKENFDIPYSSMKIYIAGQILFGNSSYKQNGDLFQLDNESINLAKVVEYDNKTGQAFETRRFIGTFDKVDAAFRHAVENGAVSVLPPETEPWGQRTCYIADPEGNLIEIGSWNKPYEEKDK